MHPDSQPIENHGVIGDLHTVALVGMDGAIDFMCFPRFDSPTLFASLLDPGRGGSFKLAPRLDDARPKQLYFPGTNILLTRFLSGDGVAEVSDFMPVEHLGHAHDLVRRAKAVRGDVRFRMSCAPRFDYGRAGHTVERKAREILFHSKGADRLSVRLRSSVPMQAKNGDAVAEFTLRAGQTAYFVLEEARTRERSPSAEREYVVRSFKETMNYWLTWIGRSRYRGHWREMVNRSALTLKLLVSRPHGSIVAAPTFGLPEEPGGVRNWDYRYTWIRDASFTVHALMRLGYTEEAAAFIRWIEPRCREHTDAAPLRIMYGLDGRSDLTEETLRRFRGYRGSRPVRVGNAACDQLQLDIYGELLDAIYIYDGAGGSISYDFWLNLVRLVDWVGEHWQQPDAGIWEVRGGPREFLYSRLLCWVAVDRGIRLALKNSFPAPLNRWVQARDQIYHTIYHEFWDSRLGAFTQSRGARALDAATLLMPLMKFISPADPRWRSTFRQIDKALVEDSLVYRYNVLEGADDGLPGQEGTFNMCSFWYVQCLTRAGDLRKARFAFEKVLSFANHLGLYSEELGRRGEHLGNFPQALTHLALISAACELDRALSGPTPAGLPRWTED